jgi:hypothetical protein
MKDETVAYLVLPAFIVVVFGGGDGSREHGERGLLELSRHTLKPDVAAQRTTSVESRRRKISKKRSLGSDDQISTSIYSCCASVADFPGKKIRAMGPA